MSSRYGLLVLTACLLSVPHVWANCDTYPHNVVLDLTLWTPEQRGYLSHVIADTIGNVATRHTFSGNTVRVCAKTVDLSGLESAVLQSAAQAAVDAYVAGNTVRQAELTEAGTEVATNTLCNAAFAVLESRIDAEKAAIQTAINAITDLATVRSYATIANNRLTAALKFIVKCEKGRAILRKG